MYDIRKVRRDFPILDRRGLGEACLPRQRRDLSETAAGAGHPQRLLRGAQRQHRGVHRLAEEAGPLRRVSREGGSVSGAPDVRGLIFTRGTTESINLVAHAWGRKNLREGDEILLIEAEHHSNLVPWQLAGAKLRFIPIREDGTLDMEVASRLISPRTKMVGCIHSSNVLATVNPVERLAELARSVEALMLVDGASAPHMPVDVASLGCDFFACSGHKMLAPRGSGCGGSRRSWMPWTRSLAGEMIREVHLEHSTWRCPTSSRPGP